MEGVLVSVAPGVTRSTVTNTGVATTRGLRVPGARLGALGH